MWYNYHMSRKFWRQVKKLYRQVARSFLKNDEKTITGLWGEDQVKKLRSLGQDMVVMQMG